MNLGKVFPSVYKLSLLNKSTGKIGANIKYISTCDSKSSSQTFNSDGPVWACNEWDPLEEVIVGRPDSGCVPPLTPEVKSCVTPKNWPFYEKYGGKYWKDALEPEHWKKANEEVENLAKVLSLEGILVKRPETYDYQQVIKTPTFESTGLYAAMPRDSLLIVADEIIEAPMTWRSRFFEYLGFRSLVLDYWKRGARWTVAPKPTYADAMFTQNYDAESEDMRTNLAGQNIYVTTEHEPTFDAADFVRAGRDIFVQRSQVTNLAGIEWVRRHLAPRGIKVHTLTFRDPRPMHMDCTFNVVGPGKAVICPDRPCNEIEMFKKAGWNIVTSPMPQITADAPAPLWLGSRWLAMNTFVIDPKRVLVEKDEVGIQQMFQKLGITPIPLPLKHAYGMGGGFHCWTCDIKRKGKLESYL